MAEKSDSRTRSGEPYVRVHKGYWHLYYRNPDPSKNYPVHKSLRLKAEQEEKAREIEAEARLVWKRHESEFRQDPAKIDRVMGDFVADRVSGGDGSFSRSGRAGTSLHEVFKEFLSSKSGKAHRTRQTYRTHVNNFERHMDCRRRITGIEPTDIEAYMNSRLTEDGVNKKTVNKELKTLRGIFKFALRRDYASKNVAKMVDKLSLEPEDKEELDEPVYIPRELYRAMLDSRAARERSPVRRVMFLLYHTGMRIGELLRLKWKDIDLDKHVIHVTASPQKGGDRSPYMVSRQLRLYLTIARRREEKAYRRGKWREDVPFGQVALIANGNGKPWNYSNLMNRRWWPFLYEFASENPSAFSKLQQAAGVSSDEDKPISFHDFRHTFITDLLTEGVNPIVVGWLVGHRELHTQRRYTHLCYRHFTEEFEDFQR